MQVGMSRALFEHYPSFRSDLGLWADYLHLLTFVRFCDQVYFIDDAFPVYRMGSGISSRTSAAEMSESFLRVLERVAVEHDSNLDRRDARFLAYLRSKHEMIVRRSLRSCAGFLRRFARNAFNGVKRSDLEVCVSILIRRWLPNGLRWRARGDVHQSDAK